MVIEQSPTAHGPHIWYAAFAWMQEGVFSDFLRIKQCAPHPPRGEQRKKNTMNVPNEYTFRPAGLLRKFLALEILWRHRLERLPMYDEEQDVLVAPIAEGVMTGGWCVHYHSLPRWQGDPWNTHIDLNIKGDLCYLLSIGLDPKLRGTGLGKQMYVLVEDYAREIGCTHVEQTASGTTSTGEPRGAYLQRLGYREKPGEYNCVYIKEL